MQCPRCDQELVPDTSERMGPFRASLPRGSHRCEACALTVLAGPRLSAEVGPGALPVSRYRVARKVARMDTKCPACSRPLRRVTFEDVGQLVTVEECGGCRLFVLDDGELPPLRRFLARAHAATGNKAQSRTSRPSRAGSPTDVFKDNDALALRFLARLLQDLDARG